MRNPKSGQKSFMFAVSRLEVAQYYLPTVDFKKGWPLHLYKTKKINTFVKMNKF